MSVFNTDVENAVESVEKDSNSKFKMLKTQLIS